MLKKSWYALKSRFFFWLKFLFSKKFREQEGIPWIRRQLQMHWGTVKSELSDSEEMLSILWRYGNGHKITLEEKKRAKEQLLDLIRMVPALAIFLLPGGAFLLPFLARALPWQLLPSSKNKSKRFHSDQ